MLDYLELNTYHKLLIDNLFSSLKFSNAAENKTKLKVFIFCIERK